MIEITKDTYPALLNSLVGLGRMVVQAVAAIDLSEMRSICEQIQAVAPVLEPTAYQRGGDLNLRDQEAFLRALDEFTTALRSLDRTESPR